MSSGRIVTFYSYKGGTGRSMALANVAWILASNGKKVLVLDWDLEAPGLHRYLTPFLHDRNLTASDGLIDFVIEFATAAATPADDLSVEERSDEEWYLPYANILRYATSINWKFERGGTIDFIPAGRQGPSYSTCVNSFNWQFFYDRLGGGVLLERAKDRMRAEYDYILIDSRTGVSDTSGICTVQMPDDLIVCFTLNNQSIEGAAAVARSVHEQRTSDRKPINIFPVAMRIENGEKDKLEARKILAREKFRAFPNHMGLEERERYWGEVQVSYVPYYAYEEILACVGDNVGDRFSVLAACEQITSYVTRHDVTRLVPLSEEDRQRILRIYEGSLTHDQLQERERFAEGALSRFSYEEQELVRQVFTRLVRVSGADELGGSTLRWVRPEEVEEPAVRMIQPLVSSGMLVQEDGRIRIADLDLLESWPQLREWIEKDRPLLLWRQMLQDKIDDWLRENKNRRLLLSGTRLKEASNWLQDQGERLNGFEQLYIRESLAGVETNASRRRRYAAVVAAVAIIATLTGVLVARWFESESPPGDGSGSVPIKSVVDCSKTLLGRPLRVGIVTWPGYAGGIVANNGFKPSADSIYYKKYNLCVELLLVEDVDVRAKAFARGGTDGIDIVWSAVDFWANELPGFHQAGINARAIMQVDWSRGADAIVADKSIKSIEDLRGKRISLTLFTPSHWLLEYSLQNSRLDEAQQTAILKALVGKNASPDARSDFVAGKVDAAVLWEPDVTEALIKRENSHVVVSTEEARKLIANIMVAREDFIRDHRDVIQGFVEGWIVDGTVKASRDPETVARLLMENEFLYQVLGPDVTLQNLATVRWADLGDNVEMFNLDGQDEEPLFDFIFNQAAKSWVARGYISAPVSPSLAKDVSFLKEIYSRNPVERNIYSLPPPSPEVATEPAIAVKPITINFAANSAALDSAARQAIDEQVSLLAETMSGAYIRVEGNTDNLGDPTYNRVLSRRRAQAVVDYLVSQHHLPETQFIAIGNGPDKPVEPNDTSEGRAKNRRLDISIVRR